MPISIYAAEQKKRRDFERWREVPPEFKTKRQWLKVGRKVLDKAKPQARVLYPRLVDNWCLDDNFLEEVTDEWALITDAPTNLFHFDQTAPYRANSRTLAYFAFEEIFFDHARKDSYILKFDKAAGRERDEWYTLTGYASIQNPADRGLLTSTAIRRHINQRDIVGIKAKDKTRFMLIDLDHHGRDLAVFEAQAEVLLNEFHGRGTWHYQVKKHDVTGLHLIRTFPNLVDLDETTTLLRQILLRLDADNPELACRAKDAGMTTLGELEIYPQRDHGVRLPLCLDREVLLDAPLSLVSFKGKMVQDVEKYVAWLQNPNRQYMPKDRILDYLHYFARLETKPKGPSPKKERVDWANGEISANGWNGNLKRRLAGFWLHGNADGLPLNEHIVVLCRLAAAAGYSQQEIEASVNAFVKELPAAARTCSSRLLKGKMRKIASVVKSTAKYACDDNGHQDDPELSMKKLKAALARWTGFDPLDKSTWSVLVTSVHITVTPKWSKQDTQAFETYLAKPLFVKDSSLLLRFVNAIVNLTLQKEKEGNGWGKDYLEKWMKDKFPEIKCAKDEKRQRILVALQELGIIKRRIEGKPKVTATHWVLGERAITAISSQSDAQATKEHLSLLEFPFSKQNEHQDEFAQEPVLQNEVEAFRPSPEPPDSFLRHSIKSGGTEGQMASSDLMDSILGRIEPACGY